MKYRKRRWSQALSWASKAGAKSRGESERVYAAYKQFVELDGPPKEIFIVEGSDEYWTEARGEGVSRYVLAETEKTGDLEDLKREVLFQVKRVVEENDYADCLENGVLQTLDYLAATGRLNTPKDTLEALLERVPQGLKCMTFYRSDKGEWSFSAYSNKRNGRGREPIRCHNAKTPAYALQAALKMVGE